MNTNFFHEKITIFLSILILSNYLFLSINLFPIAIKLNFILFIIGVLIFYSVNVNHNIYLKIFFLIIILISLGTPLFDWDPRSIWLFHAKRIFYDVSIVSVNDNYAQFSHNDYPSLVPAFSATLASLFGYWNEVFPKVAFTLVYLPALIFTCTFFKGSKYLVFLSIVLFIIGKYLFNGWMDGLVAIYFCLSSYLMYELIINDNKKINSNPYNYGVIFFFFIILTLLKNEGLVLLIILFAITVLMLLKEGRLRRSSLKLGYLTLGFVPILIWKLFCFTNGIVNEHINESFIINIIPRLKEINNYILIFKFLFLNEKFLISLIFFLFSFYIAENKKLFYFILALLLFYSFTILLVFMATPVDFYFQLNSASARIIKTLSFSLAFFGFYNLSYSKKIYFK